MGVRQAAAFREARHLSSNGARAHLSLGHAPAGRVGGAWK